MPRMPLPPGGKPFRDARLQQEAALFAQGYAHHEAGRLAEAKKAYEAVLRIDPTHPEVLTLLGTIYLQSGMPAEAISFLNISLRTYPHLPRAYNLRGIAQCKLHQFEAAVADFDRAIALDLHEAIGNRANALNYLGRFDEALAGYEQALVYDPNNPEIYHNRGSALLWRGKYDAALASFDRAIALRPDYADAHFHRAELLLLLGDFANGWKQFEWRWKLPEAQAILYHSPLPLWLGEEDIAGKTILLHAEQGYGDMLQFCRYAELVQARGATVILEVPQALTRLMRTLRGTPMVVDDRKAMPPYDFHTPLMSLPLALGTTPATIPAASPYLAADPARVKCWAARLGPRTRPRVGLVWFGSMTGGSSHLKAMAFEDLLGLTDCDADFYALQKQQTPGGGLAFQRHPNVTDLGPELEDFADTAAVMALLDVVITVDTAVAHLAGALGRPVWILLSHLKDWRWMREGSSTPWYPTARLFRQIVPNDWVGLIDVVKPELQRWIAEQR